MSFEATEIEVIMRNCDETSVFVEIQSNTTCIEAVTASGLQPRDGTSYHAWDIFGNIIDEEIACNYPFGIMIGSFPILVQVQCDKVTLRGKMGVANLDDGCIIFVPGMECGEFATVVISEHWMANDSRRCSAYKVNILGHPYEIDSLIYMAPRNANAQQFLFNPTNNTYDLPFELNCPNQDPAMFVDVNCIIRITSVNPLRGELQTRLTKSIPRNRRIFCRNRKRLAYA